MTELKELIDVVKVGTSSLLLSNERPTGTFKTVAVGVEELSGEHDVILVTSGAIGFGVRKQGLEARPELRPETRSEDAAKLQALAAMGQVGLISEWEKAFNDRTVAQILLTARELQQPNQVESLRGMLIALWTMGAVPIVNENDAITSEEITFGDNDQLAALVAVKTGAQRLVLLTDRDGVQENFGTSTERTIGRLSLANAPNHVVDTRGTTHGKESKGDMSSKIEAARIAVSHGIEVYIGSAEIPIESLLAGNSGTRIVQ